MHRVGVHKEVKSPMIFTPLTQREKPMKRSKYLPPWYKAPPKRKTYLGVVSAMPGLFMAGLWSSGCLNPATTSAAFYFSTAICFLIPITNYPHAKRLRREYLGYRKAILADLHAPNLTAKEEMQLRAYLAELQAIYHITHDPDSTYEAVAVIGTHMYRTAKTIGRLNHLVYRAVT